MSTFTDSEIDTLELPKEEEKKEKPKTKKRRVKKGKLDYFMGVSNG